MNEVNVVNLKSLVNNFNKLIEAYQKNYLNLYNELKNSSIFWTDTHALRFYDAKDMEKHKMDVSYEELTRMKDIYKYIVNKYEAIGNYISFNLDNRDALLSKINNYIENLNGILNSYNSLDYSFATSSVIYSINNQKNNIRNMLNNLYSVRNNIKSILNNISETENKIQSMINKVDIDVMPYATTERFI